ncbi:MAG: tRNA (guanosine(18)-2'-O)-methyltransferase TrmH [Pseudomonadota bacterium]
MTPERFARLRAVLDRRQPDLTVLADYVHKPHNISAIIRSCDAFGVAEVHLAMSDSDRTTFRAAKGAAQGAEKWVDITLHEHIGGAIEDLQQREFQVCAAHLSARAVSYREIDFCRPTAVLLGAEKDGVSEAVAEQVDQHIVVPMVGMVESFNVSVAAAIILSEAHNQRRSAGYFDTARLDTDRYARTLFRWAHPKVAALLDERGEPYPALDDEGSIQW